MAFMYLEESQLFRDGAKCTLPLDLSNTTINNIVYDEKTNLAHYLTANTRSVWRGLLRLDSKVPSQGTYLTEDSKSAMLLEARASTNPGVDVSQPYKNLIAYLPKINTPDIFIKILDYVGGFTATTTNTGTSITSIAGFSIPPETTHYEAVITGTGIASGTQLYNIVSTTGYLSKPATASNSNVQISFTDFILPVGYKTFDVMVNGVSKQEGATKDYTRLYDGFRETIRFNTAPGYTAWVQVKVTQDN